MRIGIDLGGTKIEALAVDAQGRELARQRIATPAGDYDAIVAAIRRLVVAIETPLGANARVGIGTPGAASPATGLIRNANSTALNGRPLAADLARALGREVRVENDANCFALSEATDGAGARHRVVFGVIVGTGVGGGLVVDGKLRVGPNAIGGEWGHNEMPARTEANLPDTACWCGRKRCIETYVSGPALAADYARRSTVATKPATRRRPASTPADSPLDAEQVVALARRGDAVASATLDRFFDRLANALSTVVNIVDPDVVVLGGGLSNVDGLAAAVQARLAAQMFCDRCATRVVRNRHGDSSGVRGAAWLWPA